MQLLLLSLVSLSRLSLAANPVTDGGTFDLSDLGQDERVYMWSDPEPQDAPYAGNINTTWDFKLGLYCTEVKLRCVYFDVTKTDNCQRDSFNIIVGEETATFCGGNSQLDDINRRIDSDFSVNFVTGDGVSGGKGFVCEAFCNVAVERPVTTEEPTTPAPVPQGFILDGGLVNLSDYELEERVPIWSHSEVKNQEYEPNKNVTWKFHLGSNCIDAKFRCSFFDVENSNNCKKDNLTITENDDGYEESFCGGEGQLDDISQRFGGDFSVTFMSDDIVDNNKGFTCEAFCMQEAPSYITSGSDINLSDYPEYERVYLWSHDTVADKVEEYPQNLNTTWNFELGNECVDVKLKCPLFDVEKSNYCKKDSFNIISNEETTSFCGGNGQTDNINQRFDADFSVNFISDDITNNNDGFQCYVYCYDQAIEPYEENSINPDLQPATTSTPVTSESAAFFASETISRQETDPAVFLLNGGWINLSGFALEEKVSIWSHAEVQNEEYEPNKNVTWKFHLGSNCIDAKFKCSLFDVEKANNCKKDVLTIKEEDDNYEESFCGGEAQLDNISQRFGGDFSVNFISDDTVDNNKGFMCEAFCMKEAPSFIASGGDINLSDYPEYERVYMWSHSTVADLEEEYPKNLHTTWNFELGESCFDVKLRCPMFDVEKSNYCKKDSFNIVTNDGETVTSFCGGNGQTDNINQHLHSDFSINFISDDETDSNAGFQCYVYCYDKASEPEEEDSINPDLQPATTAMPSTSETTESLQELSTTNTQQPTTDTAETESTTSAAPETESTTATEDQTTAVPEPESSVSEATSTAAPQDLTTAAQEPESSATAISTAAPEATSTAATEDQTTAARDPESTATEATSTAASEEQTTATLEPESTAAPEQESTAAPEDQTTAVPEPESSATVAASTVAPGDQTTAAPEPESSASEATSTVAHRDETTASPGPETYATETTSTGAPEQESTAPSEHQTTESPEATATEATSTVAPVLESTAASEDQTTEAPEHEATATVATSTSAPEQEPTAASEDQSTAVPQTSATEATSTAAPEDLTTATMEPESSATEAISTSAPEPESTAASEDQSTAAPQTSATEATSTAAPEDLTTATLEPESSATEATSTSAPEPESTAASEDQTTAAPKPESSATEAASTAVSESTTASKSEVTAELEPTPTSGAEPTEVPETTDAPPTGSVMIFEEEFNSLDDSLWEHLVTSWRGGNNEFQWFRNDRRNSFIQDSALHIIPTLTEDDYILETGDEDLIALGCKPSMDVKGKGCVLGPDQSNGIKNPIASARLRTKNAFSFKQGRLEVRAQLPKGDWLKPAIILLPESNVYGTWPRSGEIDIATSKGNDHIDCNGIEYGHQTVESTLLMGPERNNQLKFNFKESSLDNTFGDSYHTFGVEWSPNGLVFSVDGKTTGTVEPTENGFWGQGGFQGENIWQSGTNMAPFDQPFHVVLSLAVGGNQFSDNCVYTTPRPWSVPYTNGDMLSFWQDKDQWLPTWSPEGAVMKVDYIRVYEI